jgi:hypothetical protein
MKELTNNEISRGGVDDFPRRKFETVDGFSPEINVKE